jgi:soluble lytic murein transglycosylase-like protein
MKTASRKKLLIVVVAVLLFILISVKAVPKLSDMYRKALAKKVADEWSVLAEQYCAYYDLDVAVVLAIICQESSGDPNAENPADPSRGLMQVTQGALTDFLRAFPQKKYTFDDLFTPYVNIEVGTWYIATRYKKTQDLHNALAAYNAGLGNISAGQMYAASVEQYLTQVKAVYSV